VRGTRISVALILESLAAACRRRNRGRVSEPDRGIRARTLAELRIRRTATGVKILLDENLPRKLVAALRAEGHEVESGHHVADAGFGQRQTLPIRDPKFRRLLHARFWFHQQCSSGQSIGKIQVAARDAGQKPQMNSSRTSSPHFAWRTKDISSRDDRP